MTTTTYAIGDVHGRLDLLDELLERVETDAASRGSHAKIVFTGDYVDRGANSFGVIERLMAGPRRPGDSFVCLRGNHDDLFVKAVAFTDGLPEWVWILFWHTIKSYGLDRDSFVSHHPAFARHVAFITGLPLTHDDGTHLFVHAGIRPGVALADQEDQDLIWIREPFLSHPDPLPRRIVHGHTIMGNDPVLRVNRVSIDTGAYKSGVLTAAVFDGSGTVTFLQTQGEPDRGAVVREALLVERMHGRVVTPAMQAALDDFEAAHIDADTLARRMGNLVAA